MKKLTLVYILIASFLNLTISCTVFRPTKITFNNLENSQNNIINLSINDSLFTFINKDAAFYKLPATIEGYNTKNIFQTVSVDSIKEIIEPNILLKNLDSTVTISKLLLHNNTEIIFNESGGKLIENNYLIKGKLSDSSSFSVKTNKFDYLTINKLDVGGTIVQNFFLLSAILLVFGTLLFCGLIVGYGSYGIAE